MCGITGAYAFNEQGKQSFKFTKKAIESLNLRGPDANGIYQNGNVSLGHTRLSIIDTTDAGKQPFIDKTGRYVLIFNGEFYNYKEHKLLLEQEGIEFKSTSDTEVLLHLLIKYKEKALEKVNGCFSIGFYDNQTEELLLARDRMGINPLMFYKDENRLIFGSELKALMSYDIPRKIDYSTLYAYLQLNYVPGTHSMLQGVEKLKPGNYMLVSPKGIQTNSYYIIKQSEPINLSYDDAKKTLKELLDNAVKRRLVADVPLGAFLSGGIDSSVIVALASQHTPHLNTFSIVFKDEPFFDETHYAELVANKFKTNHTVFSLSNDDLLHNLPSVLDYLDEPFADSSAIAVHILSMHTRKTATVALSGDGADEMFAGYNKHFAHYKAAHGGIKIKMIEMASPFWKILPKSRNSKLGNLFRQFERFSNGLKLNQIDRYWAWASIGTEDYAKKILLKEQDPFEFNTRKSNLLQNNRNQSEINNVLFNDMQMVLPNDMLTKVDLMSMANSLEVRTPFLDHTVVDFAFSLPDSYKITSDIKKRILQDTYRDVLPEELYKRPKHGFEVPLLKWFRNELWTWIDKDLLSESYIKEQQIFNYPEIAALKKQLNSANPADSAARIWALSVFQNWYKNYIE
jgi:asparagine synthase (glutamine-hydrolysing)